MLAFYLKALMSMSCIILAAAHKQTPLMLQTCTLPLQVLEYIKSHDELMWLEVFAAGCLVWYLFILFVCAIGFLQL